MRQLQNGLGGEEIPEDDLQWAATWGARLTAAGERMTHKPLVLDALLHIPASRQFGRDAASLEASFRRVFESGITISAGRGVMMALALAGIREDLLPLRFVGLNPSALEDAGLVPDAATLQRTLHECIVDGSLQPFIRSKLYHALRSYHRKETAHVNIFEQ